MPLAFESVTHGQVAFGFFNIDTDMLLLEHYFLFAPEFCQYIRELARTPEPETFSAQWEVYDIPDRERIGDLMDAIHGIRFMGFIGQVYQRFPFPRIPEAFKQQPEGYKNRSIVEEIIREYAVEVQIPFVAQNVHGHVQIGEYEFQRPWFFELVRYVWLGGYPRWRDGLRPDYVMKMKQEIMGSRSGFFNGLVLDEL